MSGLGTPKSPKTLSILYTYIGLVFSIFCASLGARKPVEVQWAYSLELCFSQPLGAGGLKLLGVAQCLVASGCDLCGLIETEEDEYET